jgi:hypothetical protein
MSHKTSLAVSGLAASVAAFGITSGLISAKDAAIASLFAIPSALTAHVISESKSQKRINETDSRLSKTVKELDIANSRANNFEISESMGKQLQAELNKTRDALEIAKQEHQKAFNLSIHLNKVIEGLESQVATSSEEIEALQTEVEEWDIEFLSRVEVAADAKFQIARKIEIDKIFIEHDKITSEAMSITEAFQKWGMKVSQRFQDKNAAIEDTKAAYQQNIKEFTVLVTKERDCYLDQIDLLNQRIGQLQHELAGDLVEPEYLAVAYSVEGRIANDIAREVFNTLQIPLAVRGYHTRQDSSTEVAYGYSRQMGSTALVESLKRQSDNIAKALRIHKITGIKKLEIADLVVVTFRREPALKDEAAKLLAGTADEFIKYITSNPIRYRLIADPGVGKTPTTAVMLSAILKEGCRRGNTSKGKKVPHTLVSVSYPGAQSSLKDSDYPLDRFLKYGTTTAAIKSFSEALEDWEYRQQNIKFAEEFFQIRIWDELDNTINSADDPMSVSEKLKKVLKQGGHSNIGWIVSGQSVMTSQIKGFKDDDRSLFTEIIIGIPKIRMYVKKYARGKNSDTNLAKLERNLDDLEPYIEVINDKITDDARLLRIALIIDAKSPKLYFLPNLDSVDFDEVVISESENKASGIMSGRTTGSVSAENGSDSSNLCTASAAKNLPFLPKPTMQGSAICPHCGNSDLSFHKGERYYCKSCKKRFAVSKVVFK